MDFKESILTMNKPLTDAQQDETLCEMVDFNYFCHKFYGEIGDWLEENHPDDIIQRAYRIEAYRERERYENMSKKELKEDENEFKSNAKYKEDE